jgi:hypothetical protein
MVVEPVKLGWFSGSEMMAPMSSRTSLGNTA